jgi:hypothetical protein
MFEKRFHIVALLTGLVALAGCQKTEQIARYTVEKPPPIIATAAPQSTRGDDLPAVDPNAEPTDRTLAAIVPLDDKGWFFKLTGPKDAVAASGESFGAFLNSVRFNDQGKPTWTLPDGWKEQPGSQIRFATLVIPSETKPLELSVTALPKSAGDDKQYVLVNVNRWRGQLRLPPVAIEQLAAESVEVPLGSATATVVNLLGTATADSMGRPPFMSGARDGNR